MYCMKGLILKAKLDKKYSAKSGEI
jgi:hypothetical protein